MVVARFCAASLKKLEVAKLTNNLRHALSMLANERHNIMIISYLHWAWRFDAVTLLHIFMDYLLAELIHKHIFKQSVVLNVLRIPSLATLL